MVFESQCAKIGKYGTKLYVRSDTVEKKISEKIDFDRKKKSKNF